MLNRPSRTVVKAWLSRIGVGQRPNNPSPQKKKRRVAYYETLQRVTELDKCVNWFHLAEEEIQCHSPANAAIKLRGSIKDKELSDQLNCC